MPARNLRAVPDQPGRAVCYIRVSALMGRGGEDFHSPDVQLGAIQRLIANAGLRQVGDPIDDIDQTGRHFNREGIDKIKALADARKIDVVAVYDLSRLGRNVKEALDFIEYLANRNVGVISASENIDTSTPSGRLMLQQFLSWAEFYSNVVGRNWSAVIARRAEQGIAHGLPLGYSRVEKVLEVHPVDGPAMTRAFERYAAGDPIAQIVRQLSAEVGRTVWQTRLKKQFRNPIFLGKVNNLGRVLPGKHPPLVGQDTWDLVQARLERDARTPARHLAPTWSLVGITYCHQGHHMQRNRRPDGGGGPIVDRLVCGRGRSGGTSEVCKPGVPRLEDVEAVVLMRVAEYVKLLRDDVGAAAARQARATTAKVDKAGLDAQLVSVRSAMARITKRWGMEQLDDATYEEAMAELKATEANLAEASASADQIVKMPDPVQVASAAERLLAMWPDMTPGERNRALRLVVERVVVHPSKRWREPVEDRTQVLFW